MRFSIWSRRDVEIVDELPDEENDLREKKPVNM